MTTHLPWLMRWKQRWREVRQQKMMIWWSCQSGRQWQMWETDISQVGSWSKHIMNSTDRAGATQHFPAILSILFEPLRSRGGPLESPISWMCVILNSGRKPEYLGKTHARDSLATEQLHNHDALQKLYLNGACGVKSNVKCSKMFCFN